MSIVRMSPEFIATLKTGEVARVVEGGALAGATVAEVLLEPCGVEGAPYTVVIYVDDGLGDEERTIVFERVDL